MASSVDRALREWGSLRSPQTGRTNWARDVLVVRYPAIERFVGKESRVDLHLSSALNSHNIFWRFFLMDSLPSEVGTVSDPEQGSIRGTMLRSEFPEG